MYLANKWAFPEAAQYFAASRSLCSNTDSATGAVINTGFPVFKALADLISRGDEGLDNLALLAVNADPLVSVLHSLFHVG